MTATVAMRIAALLSVIFPIVAGVCMQFGATYVGWGFWGASAAVALIGMLAYLEKPEELGAFQHIDFRARHGRRPPY